MSYKPSQETIVRNTLETEFADAWKAAVIGDRHAQKSFVRRISRKGVNGRAGADI